MADYRYFPRLLLLFILQGWWWAAARGIRLTSVHIPPHVIRGQGADLQCQFDLEGEVLYTVKWYKDGKEFYQYVPAHEPPKQAFPLPGVSVDLERSSRNAVALEAAEVVSSGVYRCEVSGEAPNFNTVSDGNAIEVVVLPKEGPVITGGVPQYSVGDTADLNCTSAASRPQAQLAWLVNGHPAPRHYVRGAWSAAMPNGTLVVTVNLRFRVTSAHFALGYIKIKCVATIASVYEQWHVHSATAEGVDIYRPLVPEPAKPVVHNDKATPPPVQPPDSGDKSASGGSAIACRAMLIAALVCAVHINRR